MGYGVLVCFLLFFFLSPRDLYVVGYQTVVVRWIVAWRHVCACSVSRYSTLEIGCPNQIYSQSIWTDLHASRPYSGSKYGSKCVLGVQVRRSSETRSPAAQGKPGRGTCFVRLIIKFYSFVESTDHSGRGTSVKREWRGLRASLCVVDEDRWAPSSQYKQIMRLNASLTHFQDQAAKIQPSIIKKIQ